MEGTTGQGSGAWTGCFGMRGEGVSSFGFRNKNVKQRTWQCNNHLQPFRGSILKGRGFPFQRKLKIQQTSKILLWREKKAQTSGKSQCRDQYPCCRKGDPFQGPNLGSCLTLGNELSEETHVLTKQEIFLGKGTRVESHRVMEPRRTALSHGLWSRVLW